MRYCNWEAVHRAIEAAPNLPRPQQKEDPLRMRKTGAHRALLALIVIATHLNKETGETYLSYETIARESLTSLASAWRSVDALVNSGHLIKETGGRGKRDCNTYKFGPAMCAGVVMVEVKTPADLVPLVHPAPDPLTSSEAARQLAFRFTELLDQPTKYRPDQRETWPLIFDKLLGNHDPADLRALVEWIFKIDAFWAPKLRDSGGAMAYFEEKLDTMMTAKVYRASKPGAQRNFRNSSNGSTFDVNQLLKSSTI